MMCADIRGGILQLIVLVIGGLIYYPFINALDQQYLKEESAEAQKKSGRRLLNLDELPEEEAYEEKMTQAEKLQIEMMRMGGNKLNFQV